jgi:hypothetical protein
MFDDVFSREIEVRVWEVSDLLSRELTVLLTGMNGKA